MKQQTLIPLSEYVDKVREIPKMLSKDKLKLIYDFSDKLKLIPTIADFIPAVYDGEKWRVLEKPKFYYNDEALKNLKGVELKIAKEINETVDQYQTALNNVKFSGWEVECVTDNSVYIINPKQDKKFVFDLKSGIMKEFYGMSTSYSDLTILNLPLTERGITHFNINI